ncbi:MAG: GGDEF domain-containing protein [Desulfitobacterium sp.]|nr:GGDEF domain-containing protein [Desulfitobacterium sp.]
MNSETNLVTALNLFTKRCLTLFSCSVVAIYLQEEGNYTLYSISATNEEYRNSFLQKNSTKDFQPNTFELNEREKEWVLPLTHFEKTLGLLVLGFSQIDDNTKKLKNFLNTVVSLTSSFIFERQLRVDALEREQALTLLLRGTEILVQSESEAQLLSEAGEMAMEILFLPGGFFLLEDPDGTWEIRSPFGRLRQEMEWDWRTWVKHYISKEDCFRRSTMVHYLDIEDNPFNWERVWIHPLQTHHSGVIGELWLMNTKEHLSDKKQEILAAFVRVVGVALETMRQKEELTHLANTDRLTGILNRQGFEQRMREEMASTLRRNSSFLLLVLDLDLFKQLNDTKGHPVGDMALKEIAQNLRSAVREQDIVARTGGDEFTVILTDICKKEESLQVIRRMRKSMGLERYNLGVSIGVAEFPSEGRTYEELYRLADQRLYRGKNLGKGYIITN